MPSRTLVEAQVRDPVGADRARDEQQVSDVGLVKAEDVVVRANIVERDVSGRTHPWVGQQRR